MRRRRQSVQRAKFLTSKEHTDAVAEEIECEKHSREACFICRAERNKTTITGEEFMQLDDLDLLFISDDLLPSTHKYLFKGDTQHGPFKVRGYTPSNAADNLGEYLLLLGYKGDAFRCLQSGSSITTYFKFTDQDGGYEIVGDNRAKT